MTRVLVSLGTDHHPFERLTRWVQRLAADNPEYDVLVQNGASPPPAGVDSVAFMDPRELNDEIERADVVVTHGGPGSIYDAIRGGHIPVVVPRERRLGEHVDDHQVRFATRLAEDGVVLLARSEPDFSAAVDSAIHMRDAEGPGTLTGLEARQAVDRLGQLIDEVLARSSRKQR